MWRPPQRIQFEPKPGRIPSAREAAASRLFSPVRVGALELEQRTWVPAMVPWRASDEGYVTDDVVDWYCRFARGRPGAIVTRPTVRGGDFSGRGVLWHHRWVVIRALKAPATGGVLRHVAARDDSA